MVSIVAKIRKKLDSRYFHYYSVLALVFIIYFYVSFYTRDPDLGWHLRAGKYFIENGIPRYDVFSFTAADFAWINHEWANDVITYTFSFIGGKALLSFFFATLWCLALHLSSRKNNSSVLLLGALAMLPFAGVRPVVWTVFFVATLERILESKNLRLRYLIPLLFLAWANLHGSFAFGLVLLVLWQIFKSPKLNWVVFISSIVAVFINPYFFRVFWEIGSTLGDWSLRFQISEWYPLKLPWVSVLYVGAFLVLNFAVNRRPFKKLLSVPGLTLAMALSSIRHLPIFVVTSLRYMEEAWAELSDMASKIVLPKKFKALIAVSLSIFILSSLYFSIQAIRGASLSANYYPENFVKQINSLSCSRNLFNEYGFGGYIIEKLPDYKTYIDGRMPSWQLGSKKYFNDYRRFTQNDEFRKSEIEKYDINCAIISTTNDLRSKLVNDGWKIVPEASSSSYILLKK